MSFLQRFLERVLRTNTSRMPRTSFDDLSQDQLDAHLRVGRYGNFALTDAVRPSFGLEVIPREGYRRDVYCDPETGNKMPVLAAIVSAERLFDVLMDLLDPLGEEVDVVMESSHESEPGSHADLYREHMDTVILKSTLYDYEPLLLHDGCTGLAALNPNGPMEVQFDEHKLLFVYAHDLEPFEEILLDHGLKRDDTLKFISEAEHLHSTDDVYRDQFEELRYRLGIDVEVTTRRPADRRPGRVGSSSMGAITRGEGRGRACRMNRRARPRPALRCAVRDRGAGIPHRAPSEISEFISLGNDPLIPSSSEWGGPGRQAGRRNGAVGPPAGYVPPGPTAQLRLRPCVNSRSME